jgi:long-chain acyl-CoA synthetase
VVHAEVVTKPGTIATSDEIVAVCRERIGGYKVPRSVVIRTEPLPKSGAGKILKRSLREPYWRDRERSVN